MDNFSKIEIDQNDYIKKNNHNFPKMNLGLFKKIKSKKLLKISLFIFLFLSSLIGLLALLLYQPVSSSVLKAKLAFASGKEAYALVKNQNVVDSANKLKEAKKNLLDAQNNLNQIKWVNYLPLVKSYYQDMVHGINAALTSVDTGLIILETLIPHADVLGLKGQGSFVLGSAEERIQKTVQTMDKITPQIGIVEKNIKIVRDEIDQINLEHYPKMILKQDLKNQINSARKMIDQAALSVGQAKPMLETLPSILGQPDEKKYLILFQNDKELRSTGGFITAYAVFRVEQGKIFAEESKDIYDIDNLKTRNFPAPAPILKYFPLVYNWHLRDTNISPDFKISISNFETLYASIPKRVKYDGIIAIDTHMLLKVMEVLGPIEIYGTRFTTDIVPECNCPHVIYELEKYADKPVGYERGSRKDLIGQLMMAILKKSLGSPPKLYWGRLFQTGIEALNQKHILLYFKDEKAQKGAENLNFAGRIKEFEGDYLHVNDTNFAGAKSNMYVQHEVNQVINREADGSIVKTITLKYKNPQKPSNCDLEKGELCLNGLLRNWVRIYVPKGSKLLESKGSEVKVSTYEDLGKTVFDGFLTVRPLGQAHITFKYKLPFKIKGNLLPILIQKQPGTIGHKYIIEAAGKIQEFPLVTDKEIIIDF